MRIALLFLSLFATGCGNSDTCVPLLNEAMDLVMQKGCSQDSDCMIVIAECGLPGMCGTAVNAQAGAELLSVSKQWKSDCPNDAETCPHCPSAPMTAKCDAGTCSCVEGCGPG
jgi:hypothetical protein